MRRIRHHLQKSMLAKALCVFLVVVGTAGAVRLPTFLRSGDSEVGAQVRRDMKYLSDMTLKGRAPGTPGETLAAKYIVGELQKIPGVEPAGEAGGYTREVPLRGTTVARIGSGAERSTLSLGGLELGHLKEYVASTDVAAAPSESGVSVGFKDAEVVFVGHGIYAPELKWDDYKGVNTTGKVLLMFTNEPASIEQPGEMTYYGRWSYKYEEGRRRGAAGVILIHTNETAGYPFSVVLSSNSGEQVTLDKAVEGTPLQARGWVSLAIGERIARAHGATVAKWLEQAADPAFQPIGLGADWRATHEATYDQRFFKGTSVLASLQGGSRPSEAVVFTGHLDHLGERNGKVYPGAVDNACGAAMVLALARRFAKEYKEARPQRSILFFFPTAEESGLLGSEEYVATAPAFPLEGTVAAINFDIGNVWGPTRDVVVLGAGKSDLGGVIEAAARPLDLALSPDPTPSAGMFYRSDHLNFARKGVPAVWVATGVKFVDRPPDYYNQTVGDYIRNHYHQPSDIYHPQWTMVGVEQQIDVAYGAGRALVSSHDRLKCYNPDGTCL